MAAASSSAVTAAAVAITASAAALLFPNPNPRLPRSSSRPPSSLRFQPLPSPSPLRLSRRPPPLSIFAVAVPSFIPSAPPSAISAVLKLARPLPLILLASVRSLPARITAAASRAAPTPEQLAALRALFSAALANRPPSGYYINPLQALSTGAASWLGLYAEILSVRCLLSWFPNIPWEKQPFSALRDLCDPYLAFCQKIFPPINGFDASPLLAFWVLGIVANLLNINRPA